MLVKLLYRSSFLKTTALLFSLFFYSQQLLAQKQTGYTLLWEISGKGMSKPSYVFASANFKDSRVYNFSDSVYIALANSAAFVLEIHPDTLIKSMVNFGWNTAKKPSNGTVPNMYQQISPNGYLYGLAKTYQKNSYGLDKNATANRKLERAAQEEEDAYDEEELLAQEDALEVLIDAYASGNLNNIWGEIQPYYQEDDIIDYAQMLTTEMIALMQKETLFASISLVYLPSENGVIALLKKAGYQLRPVGGNFTALAKDHTIDYSKMQWYKFKDENNNYSVDFPGKPHEYKHDGRSKIQGFVDPITNTLFKSTALYTGPLNNTTVAQYQDTVLNNYLKETGYTLVKTSREDKFGTSVLITEYANPKENELIKSKAIHLNGTYYTFTMIYNAYFNDNKAFDLFFNSIQISTPTAVASSQWVDYKNEIAAFSIKLPVMPNESKQEVPNAVLPESPYLLNYYMATDKVNLMNYIVRYSDYPPGMYIIDKKTIFEGIIAEFKQKGELASEIKTVNNAGHEGVAVDIIVSNTYLETMLFIKGNRVYMMVKQNMNGPTKGKKDQFFESFTLLPNLANKGITFAMDHMELVMPEQPLQLNNKADDDDTEAEKGASFLVSQKSFAALNRYTGGSYAIEKSVISKYYKTQALDTLLNRFVRELSKEQKLLADRTVSVGKEKGREFMSYNESANIYKKSRIWVHGNSLYMQTLMGSEQEINSELANAFFDIKIKAEVSEPLFDFKSSKAPILVQDLTSSNQDIRELASGALSFYGFEKADLPQLYKALKHKYTNDTASYGTRERLLHVLKELNDQQTPAFLKELYKENKGLDVIQSNILYTLPYVDEKSYDWYFKTLTSSPTYQLKNYWQLFAPLTDSVAYVAANIDETLKLLKVEEYRPMVLDLVSTMLSDENKPTYISLLEGKKEPITAFALKDLATDVIRLKGNNYNLTVYDYLNILTKLKLTSLADSYTQQVLNIDSVDYLHTNAIAARIKLNLAVTPALLTAKLDSLSSRYLLMRAYDELGKIDEVPLKYRKHEEVAKLLMYHYLVEEYDVPNNINLLDTIKEGDLTYYAFEFSYTVEGAQQIYIGVTGPFNSKKEALDFKTYYSMSNLDIKTKDWLKTAKALIKEMNE